MIFVWLEIGIILRLGKFQIKQGNTHHFYRGCCLFIIQFCCITHFKGIDAVVPENLPFIFFLTRFMFLLIEVHSFKCLVYTLKSPHFICNFFFWQNQISVPSIEKRKLFWVFGNKKF